MEQALDDVKVLDLTHHVAGPHCTKILAQFGAEVIKVERPGTGDPTRHMGPFLNDIPHPEKSGLFFYLNSDKKGITLNLKHPTGVQLLKELVKQADVLVESFSPRVMSSLGLSYEELEAINPNLIMTSISSFGQTGPYRDYQATNMIMDAINGCLYLRGQADRAPVHVGFSIAEHFGGAAGFSATMMALYGRNRGGKGQHVDVSIMASLLNQTDNVVVGQYCQQGSIPNRSYYTARYGVFLTAKDGHILPRPGPGGWETLAAFLNLPEIEDERFATTAGRFEHAEEINELTASRTREEEKVDLFKRAQEWRLPFGYVATTEDLLKDEQYRSRGYFVTVDHPEMGKVTCPGAPFQMSETPWRTERPAPLLGEHNEEILCGRLGLSKAELTQLNQAGTI
ncbi:CaiB/BaiF CoA transferase family protein [Chloroflexota bacterium]